MKKTEFSEAFGQFNMSYHGGRCVLLHARHEQLCLYDFSSLDEIERINFKMPIYKMLMLNTNKSLEMRVVVITVDGFAHIIQNQNNSFKKTKSIDLKQSIQSNYIAFINFKSRIYILSENRIVIISSSDKTNRNQISWPPKTMTRIQHFENYGQFEGERTVAPNSHGFFAYHYVGEQCHITSWIYDFRTDTVINGPYSIQVSPFSIYLSPFHYIQGDSIYSVRKKQKIGTISNVSCISSNVISDSSNNLFEISDNGIKQIKLLTTSPFQILSNESEYHCLNFDGTMDNLKIFPHYSISSYLSLFAIPCTPKLNIFPTVEAPEQNPCSLNFTQEIITSKPGGKWESPHKIVSYDSIRVGQYDFFIAATSATVHIYKSHLKNPSILPIDEFNWESAVLAVSLNSKLYSVSSVDKRIKIQQYIGDEYSFTFESSLCVSISMSETLLVSGFIDGSLIAISLTDKTSLCSIHPFRVAINSISRLSNDNFLVQWDKVYGKLSTTKLEWVKFPEFPSGYNICFSDYGILTIGNSNSVNVYSFANGQILTTIPQKSISICSYQRRIYILTIYNEVIVLYYRNVLKLETQFVIDVDTPINIKASKEIIYIITLKNLIMYDKKGKRINEISLNYRPRAIDSIDNGIYLLYQRYVLFVQSLKEMKKIEFDLQNICFLSAIDELRFIIASNNRVIYCEKKGQKTSFAPLAKTEKNIIGIKCFPKLPKEPLNMIMILLEDGSTHQLAIPKYK